MFRYLIKARRDIPPSGCHLELQNNSRKIGKYRYKRHTASFPDETQSGNVRAKEKGLVYGIDEKRARSKTLDENFLYASLRTLYFRAAKGKRRE